MDARKKLSVLRTVAQSFHRAKITWAVGASLLLYCKGITDDFHDIDILVAECDLPRVKALLDARSMPQVHTPNARYQTHVFLEYLIDGVEFDIMAGLAIVADGCCHRFPLKAEDICAFFDLDGIPIPLHSVDLWRQYYSLIGRPEKVRLIEAFLASQD